MTQSSSCHFIILLLRIILCKSERLGETFTKHAMTWTWIRDKTWKLSTSMFQRGEMIKKLYKNEDLEFIFSDSEKKNTNNYSTSPWFLRIYFKMFSLHFLYNHIFKVISLFTIIEIFLNAGLIAVVRELIGLLDC